MTANDFPLYRNRGRYIRAKDGDTIVVNFDFGQGLKQDQDHRLEGYDAAELNGPFRKQALAAMADLDEICTEVDPKTGARVGRVLYLETVKDKKSYGRYRVWAWVEKVPGAPLVSVNAAMAFHDMRYVDPP